MGKKMLLPVAGGVLLIGCAPVGPPPPFLGPGPWGSIWLLFLILIGAGIYLLIRKISTSNTPKKDHLAEALNDIHERLKHLEEKIDNLEKKE